MGGYQFDASPEEHADILRQMDAMVAMWSSKGVDVGYNVPTNPTDSDLDDDSGIELQHAAAVYKSLAVQICPMYGKQPNILLIKTQEDAYNAMLSVWQPNRHDSTLSVIRSVLAIVATDVGASNASPYSERYLCRHYIGLSHVISGQSCASAQRYRHQQRLPAHR